MLSDWRSTENRAPGSAKTLCSKPKIALTPPPVAATSSSTDFAASGSGRPSPSSKSNAASPMLLAYGAIERNGRRGHKDARVCGVRRVFVADTDHGLGAAQEKRPIARQLAAHTIENVALGQEVEIDQNIAAKDDIERAERAETFEEIEGAEFDALAHRRLDPPPLLLFLEIFREHLNGQTTLRFEMRIEALAATLDHLAGDVASDHLDVEAV